MQDSYKVKKLGVILSATSNYFEREGVLNPAVFQEGNYVHLFYRAMDPKHESCIGYAKLKGPTKVVERWDKPIIEREYSYESKGVEDPRIVKIGKTFYLTYVVHEGKNALTALATSHDLKRFRKRGIISPKITYHEAETIFSQEHLKDSYFMFASYYEEWAGKDVLLWHKDLILFPKKINGRYVLLHRVLPDIQIAFFLKFKDLTNDYWRNHLKQLSNYVILQNKHWFETRNIGGGAPPVETDEGWLVIYHAVEEAIKKRVYHAGVALLDKTNPKKVIGMLHKPLISPTEEWEKVGHVADVVFPTGTAVFGDKLYIYYGAADKRIAVASVALKPLLKEIKRLGMTHDHERNLHRK